MFPLVVEVSGVENISKNHKRRTNFGAKALGFYPSGGGIVYAIFGAVTLREKI